MKAILFTVLSAATVLMLCSSQAKEPESQEKVIVSIAGEVADPGKHTLPAMCDLSALGRLGCKTTPFSDLKNIVIFRFKRREGHISNWSKLPRNDEIIRVSEHDWKSFKIQFGDIIYVPQRVVTAS